MKRVVTMVAAILVLASGLANAREPSEDEREPVPAPIVSTADPDAYAVPSGLYYVTDTYVADVTMSNGATTTYSTTTVHESTGTYARVLDTVDTGTSSAFDGVAFNGRGALSDGRALAGTYYENYVLTASGYVPVSIVFFQDDAESRRLAWPRSSSQVATPPTGTSAETLTAAVAPDNPVGPASAIAPPTWIAPQRPTTASGPRLRAGVALAANGPALTSAEVMRGRLVQFWPRVFANDVAVLIRSWRLVSAHPDQVSATAGSSEPLTAGWLRMPEPGTRLLLRFEVSSEAAPLELLEAQITITVRSPALVE